MPVVSGVCCHLETIVAITELFDDNRPVPWSPSENFIYFFLLFSRRVLVKCVTVPKLIQHADELEQMLEIAADLDLAGA